ncbi:helix-turn-helix transcriptional regulator [Clostridium sp. PL3]|uniref:Helix-turn-helix transcriptional regulator n=1 Tax=Clostridium thailandense TaxID=2794346 RepID=A0A949TWI2_9CLOT|nr:helix-turn-helix transcriptional regulator [Clostridium thailandense]MBV7273773.1 helix-turn-helix transcriptional regulator [Clostridium thailandense]
MLEDTSLTPQEVANKLKIAKNTVYELIKRGELNGYKVGKKIRIDLKDVEEYKNRTKQIKIKNTEINQNTPSKFIKTSSLLLEDIYSNDGFIICGQDMLLDILSRYLELHPNGVHALRSYTGSYNGLLALYQGNVQVATSHLWDGDSNQYNIPYVRRLVPGIPTVIIHLACRMQGFYVAKGNPKNIKTWEDLKKPNIIIINREKGCGTRILLDEQLRKLNIDRYKIKGYNKEVFSHLAVASSVARGSADVGLGNEKTSLQVQNIDFIPLQNERYELVIKKEDLNKPSFKAIIDIVRSKEFKTELLGIGGYVITETGNIIAEL